MRTPTPTAAVLVLLMSTTLCAPVAAAQTEENPAAGAAEGSAPGPVAGGARLDRAWWNQQRFMEALALDEAQRGAMDRELLDHLATRRALAITAARQRRSLGSELTAGDWQGAEEAAAAVAAAHAALGREEAELTIAVARLLNDEQRRKVAAEFPHLLDRPLVVGGVGRRFRSSLAPGAGRGSGQRNPAAGSTPGSPPRR